MARGLGAARLVKTWENQLNQDLQKHTQKTNTNGELLFTTPDGKTTTRHEHVSLAERGGEVLYLAPPDLEDRTNNGQGYTLSELEKHFFDDNFKQTHIDGRWVDSHNYINNTQNRLVNRVQYEPLVEPYYFAVEYVEKQGQELFKIGDDIQQICNEYQALEISLAEVLDQHLWLTGSILSGVLNRIMVSYPKLVDFQQRMHQLQKHNASLKVKQVASV